MQNDVFRKRPSICSLVILMLYSCTIWNAFEKKKRPHAGRYNTSNVQADVSNKFLKCEHRSVSLTHKVMYFK